MVTIRGNIFIMELVSEMGSLIEKTGLIEHILYMGFGELSHGFAAVK